MNRFFRLCRLYLKTALSCMGRALITLAAILIIAALLLWKVCGDSEGTISIAKVGMVTIDDSDEMNLLYDFIRQMPVMKGCLCIETYSESEAMEELKNGNLQMVIVVPKDFMYDAEHMRDTSLELYVPKGNILANDRVYSLLSSVESLMITTESAIIGMYDGMELYSYNTTVGEMENTLTGTYIRSFINRDEKFDIEYLSIYGNYSPILYYGVGLILFISSVMGVFMLRGYSSGILETEKLLMLNHKDKVKNRLAKIVCFSIPYILIDSVLLFVFFKVCEYLEYDVYFSAALIPQILLVSLLTSAYVHLYANLARREGREALYLLLIIFARLVPISEYLPPSLNLYGILGIITDGKKYTIIGSVVYLLLFVVLSLILTGRSIEFNTLFNTSGKITRNRLNGSIYTKWFFLKLKQNLKSILLWLEAIILVLTLVTVNVLVQKSIDNNRVVYTSDKDTKELIKPLAKSDYSGFSFESLDSDSIKKEILNGKAVAGVEVSLGGIKLYAPTGSYSAILLRELIFPYVIKKESPSMLSDYLKGIGVNEQDRKYAVVMDSNRSLLESTKLNIFKVSEIETDYDFGKKVISIPILLAVILIIIACLISAAYEKKTHRGFLNSKNNFVRIALVIESGLIRGLLLTVITIVTIILI